MRQISITGLIALGMTFVILTAGIDLSVGSLLALSRHGRRRGRQGLDRQHAVARRDEATSAMAGSRRMLAAIAVGMLCGLRCRGSASRVLKVPPFVVTLGGLSIFRGLTLWFSNGGPISGFDADYRWWGKGMIGPVPVPVIIFLVARGHLPHRAALHALRPARLCGRRQPRGGAALGPAGRPHHPVASM